jgi:hydrogenase maturation protein HypF
MVSGIVQGVGFRPFVYRIAVKHGLVGSVRNRGDAGVEIIVEGTEPHIKQFLEDLRTKTPPIAQIYELDVRYGESCDTFESFSILKSSETMELSGSVIPTDVSICDDCLRELRTPKDKRFDYFFITCTNCGPRYTIINALPYDRPQTTMHAFPMCDFCQSEYTHPANRRFHAQTVACSTCGPTAYLTRNDGQPITHPDAIREAGRLLGEGYILAIKGNGGFHIATATLQSTPIVRLRTIKHRAQKPFAIMARDMKAVTSFAEVSQDEARLLISYIKPITLLSKSEKYYLSPQIAPDLHNIGVMLPYTGLHVMLFDEVQEPAFVMTSANPPNQPIITSNQEALTKLGSVVDYFLLHNRTIAQRSDDSVVRFHNTQPIIIRRSRGYAPQPVRLNHSVSRCALGVGAELMVTACVLLRNKAFFSQHIGDVENLETLEFLQDTIKHLTRLTNSHIDVIACDLHPEFNTTRLAHRLRNHYTCSLVPVQHHHAHIASLMGEHNIPEMIGIACDGFGYGSDGHAWGGEILHCHPEGFKRLGHLQEQPLIGGDLATRNPLRMAAGILQGTQDIEPWLLAHSKYFPHGRREVEVVLTQLKTSSLPQTTSCGRVLDAIAAILGICYERTYEGEPAIKLEAAALQGRNVVQLAPQHEGHTVNTATLVDTLFSLRDQYSVADLAYSAQTYLATGLAQLAVEAAERLQVKHIGFSGGVAYNAHITKTLQTIIENQRFTFVTHRQVPPGDGGISFGQAMVATTSPRGVQGERSDNVHTGPRRL